MKNFKFELGENMFIFYNGDTLGAAIYAFVKHRPELVLQITRIIEVEK